MTRVPIAEFLAANPPPPSRWIEFHLAEAQPAKTQRWDVLTKPDEPSTAFHRQQQRPLRVHLGRVGWFGRWRCYAFVPNRALDVVFEKDCLRDIAAFCEHETAKWSEGKRKARAERLANR